MRKPWIRLFAACLLACVCLCSALNTMAEAVQVGEDTPAIRYASVATEQGTLNVRSKPEDGANVQDRLAKGAIVHILEDLDGWKQIAYNNGRSTGYVVERFIAEITEFPYETLKSGDSSDAIMRFKRALSRLGYLKEEDIGKRYDNAMERAVAKMQLLNGFALNPSAVTPEMQALMEWAQIVKAKSGYIDTMEDEETGLMVSVFCWDCASMRYEDDQAVKVDITYAVQAAGGVPPYTITVKKSADGGGEAYADEVSDVFSHIWNESTGTIYIYATAVDAVGNTVTACTPFRYALPMY